MATVPTILIVEDDQGVATLERRRLERVGYAVTTATTAAGALSQLGEREVSLILLDQGLPGEMDGLTFFAQLKASGYNVPVILVTGLSDLGTATRALRAGVRDFVSKTPDYLDYIPDAVARVLGQVRIEQQLAESEARLAAIISSAKDAIIVAEQDFTITLFNRAAEGMFRCSAEQALGEPLTRFLPDLQQLASQRASSDVEDPHRDGGSMHGCRYDGETFPVEASFSQGQGVEQTFHTVIVRDVTERRRLESQLRHAQRMEAVGRLAGGVAHDFNNLLTVIGGYTEMLLADMDETHPMREPVAVMRQAGEQAAALTQQLLVFSRRQVVQPQVLDVNSVVSDLGRMLRRLIGEDIDLTLLLAPGVAPVRADPRQIEQVLMNLVVNARDAMPDGGQLTVETADIVFDEHDSHVRTDVKPGRYVRIAVTDSGTGMDDATRARIFEPFFTTKDPGKGTGLGLATVYGIVTQHEGVIEVYSEPQHGTVFKVYLPAAFTAEPVGASIEPAIVPMGLGETVLLVEDSDAVRELLAETLERQNYRVLIANDGAEGVALSDSFDGTIDLLVTDMVMPHLGGREVADHVRAARPGTKVLFLSGYTDDTIVRHGVLEPGAAFMQKPVGPRKLLIRVRELLDGS
jgi:two-component system cell cycle sensor histidine kinase/response regulator CckA